MKKFALYIALTLTALLVFSCGQQTQEDTEEAAVPVTVAKIHTGDLQQSIEYQGDIKADVEVNVMAKIPDRIEQIYVEEGDYVKKGQPIAKIFATTIQQGVRQAEAGLEAAQAQLANMQEEYERIERLFNEGAVSAQQHDQVETQFKAVKAQVEQAKAAVVSAKSGFSDATVTAPISGMVGKRYVEVGDMASPAMPIVSIVQDQKMEIKFEATERDLGKLKNGQQAYIRVSAYPEKVFTGLVSRISPVLDPMTRMASVEVTIDNKEKMLKSGMFARIEIITGTLEDVLLVPRFATMESTSLLREAGRDRVEKKYFVFVAEGDSAVKRELDVDYVNHVNIAVKGGVAAGEKLVVEGQNNLKNGIAITIVKEDTSI